MAFPEKKSPRSVLDEFCDLCEVPRSVLADLVDRRPGSTAVEWAQTINEWLIANNRSPIMMQRLPALPKERPPWDTPTKLLEHCQSLREEWSLSRDDPLVQVFLVPRIREAWTAMRLMGGSVPQEPETLETPDECARAIDEVVRWCEAQRSASGAKTDAVAAKLGEGALIALLRVFTNRLSDDLFEEAARLLSDAQMTANEKLTEIDALIPLPATASAEQLGEMLGVTKQAVIKTDWWTQNRRGEKDNEIGRRRAGHQKRAKGYEPPGTNDDDE